MFDYSQFKIGIFKNRLNRFISQAEIDGKTEKIYVPNTGRLSELAIPGNKILLEEYQGKYRYKLKYIIHNDFPVMINSSHSNGVFQEILKDPTRTPFPELKFIRSEPTLGTHRFDFLMEEGERERYIELKSCTLGYKTVASFPDAISARASKHIRALAQMGRGTIVFLLLLDKINIFVPNYHTDFEFYQTLKEYADRIELKALLVKYDKKLRISSLQEIPVEIPKVEPRGIYSLVLRNNSPIDIRVSECIDLKLPKGYFLYTASGEENLFKTIAKQRRVTKKARTPLDFIKQHMKIIADTPIVTDIIGEEELANSMSQIADREIENFSEAPPGSHLFHFKENPIQSPHFWKRILDFRFGRFL